MRGAISIKSDVKCADIACLFASMANKICDDAMVVSFDSLLRKVDLSTKGSIIQNAKSIVVNGGGTAISLPLLYLLENKIKVDRMILFSDYEANRNKELAQKYVQKYRKEINSDFWVHAVDLQGYGTQ